MTVLSKKYYRHMSTNSCEFETQLTLTCGLRFSLGQVANFFPSKIPLHMIVKSTCATFRNPLKINPKYCEVEILKYGQQLGSIYLCFEEKTWLRSLMYI